MGLLQSLNRLAQRCFFCMSLIAAKGSIRNNKPKVSLEMRRCHLRRQIRASAMILLPASFANLMSPRERYITANSTEPNDDKLDQGRSRRIARVGNPLFEFRDAKLIFLFGSRAPTCRSAPTGMPIGSGRCCEIEVFRHEFEAVASVAPEIGRMLRHQRGGELGKPEDNRAPEQLFPLFPRHIQGAEHGILGLSRTAWSVPDRRRKCRRERP